MAINEDAMSNEDIITNYLFPEDAEELPEEEVSRAEEDSDEVEDTEEDSSEEVEDDEVDEGEKESDERWMPKSLDELAAAMEVEPDDLKSIRVKTKVDGIEGEATLAEVIKNYQINKSLTERSEAFAHKQKQFEEATKKAAEEYQQKIESAEAVTQVLEERLKSEIGKIDWDRLYADDPGEWAAKRQQYAEQIGEVEQMKQTIIKQRQESMQKQQQEYLAAQQQMLKQNHENLLAAIPELRDSETREKELSSLRTYLKNQKISDEEINGIVDYRMVVLARKAKAYDEMQTKANPVKAKAKLQPKFTKPGTVKSKDAHNDVKSKKKIQRAAKTQNVEDWTSVLEDRLFS